MEKKDILKIGIVMILLVFVIIVFYVIDKYEKNIVNAVVVNEKAKIYGRAKESAKVKDELEAGENVSILSDFIDEENKSWYKIKYGNKKGYVLAENVDYYKFDNDEYVLMSDVSKFNIQYETIKSTKDYERFLVTNDINYVYIRVGGRGYGEKGIFYKDPEYQKFIDACDYLGVPYGFYFIDEAINLEEIEEEKEWILDFIKENATENNVLPFAIDIEKFEVKARTDDIWDKRGELVQELINKLNENGVETIVYSNAKRANEYLSEMDTYFWLAYYVKNNELPSKWINEVDIEDGLREELTDKTIAWQFSDKGIKDLVKEKVDMNLIKNDFFKKFMDKSHE